MGVDTISITPAQHVRARRETEPSLGLWDVELILRVLARVYGLSIPVAEASRRAVSLGLLEIPAEGAPALLTAQAAGRLFLAGYRVPAHVDYGTERILRHQLQEGCTVFVPLASLDEEPPATDYVVRGLHHLLRLGELVLVRDFDESASISELLSPSEFHSRWENAGQVFLAAAPRWSRLPCQGRRFFAGTRNTDGSLHWSTAGCDTDANGEILRY